MGDATPSSPLPRRHRADPVFIAQVVVAAVLPWVVGVLLRPASPWWGVAVLIGIGAFATLHRAVRSVWALVASAAVSVGALAFDPVPAWYASVAGLTAMAALVTVLLAPRSTPHSSTPRAAAAIGWALVAVGLLTAGLGLLVNQAADDRFDEGQAAMAAQFDEESAAPAATSPLSATGSTEGATSPLVGPVDTATSESGTPASLDPAPSTAGPSVRPPLARLDFRRPGSATPPVTSTPLYVGPDVTPAGLAAGPGHYPQTALPGKRGNTAIAGHRTGWGSPFLHLDDLVRGDEVVLTTPDGEAYTYVVDLVTIVEPASAWVLEPDPLGTGPRTLTLTTCDPPGTAEQRLVVFATLAS